MTTKKDVFAEVERAGAKTRYVKIGTATDHGDGRMTLHLEALPLGPNVEIRPEEKKEKADRE
jgi:hypothetical protein